MIRALCLSCLLMADSQDPRSQTADPSLSKADLIVLRHCTTEFIQSTLLGSPAFGMAIQECLVRLGDKVKAKQVLGRMRYWDIEAEIKRNEAAAMSDVEIRLYESRHALAVTNLKVAEGLMQRRAVSTLEYTSHRIEAESARIEVENAKYRRQLAQLDYEHSKARLHMQELITPHDGTVVAIFKKEGEACGAEPIFQVVDTSQVRVTGFLDVVDIWRVRPGQPVRISPEIEGANLAIEEEVFSGRVIFVDRSVDPKTQTSKVIAEVDNREELLRAGLKARMVILLDETAGAEAVRLKPVSGQSMDAPAPYLIDKTRLPDMAGLTDPDPGSRAQPARAVPLIKTRR